MISHIIIQSSLYQAALLGDTRYLEEAVIAKYGAEMQQYKSPDQGNNIVHIAVRQGYKESVQHLISILQKSTANSTTAVTNNQGDNPFHVALRSRNLAAAEALLEYTDENNYRFWPLRTSLGRALYSSISNIALNM